MAVRRLAAEQPESFAFSEENLAWARAQIEKYPEGRQASAVIPIMWRVQEQEGWVCEPAIRSIAEMLDMAYIRVLEVATFYTMFQLSPVGSTAHIQVCGTTPCMLRGADEIIAICKRRIAAAPHALSADGRFSWEEVECLGACVNAPMVQMVKDTYEDLDTESFEALLDTWERGETPKPGPQNGRIFAAPAGGLTSLTDPGLYDGTIARQMRIPIETPEPAENPPTAEPAATAPAKPAAADDRASVAEKAAAVEKAAPEAKTAAPVKKPAAAKKAPTASKPAAEKTESAVGLDDAERPVALAAPEGGKADDLKRIKGIGPKIEDILHSIGVFHFHQIALWNDDNKIWVDGYLRFKGRIDREDWINQAKTLSSGAETEFSKRVEAGDVPSSRS